MDSSELTQKLQNDIHKVTNYLQKVANYRYHLLIYKIMKKGRMKVKDLAEDSGYTIDNLYKIVDTFDAKQESPE